MIKICDICEEEADELEDCDRCDNSACDDCYNEIGVEIVCTDCSGG